MSTPIEVLVWVGHIDRERDYNSIVVALDWSAPDALDHDAQQAFMWAFDCGVSEPPGVGFYVWTASFEWYNNRGSIPDGEAGCHVYGQSWRPARAVEVWQAQANAKARGALS